MDPLHHNDFATDLDEKASAAEADARADRNYFRMMVTTFAGQIVETAKARQIELRPDETIYVKREGGIGRTSRAGSVESVADFLFETLTEHCLDLAGEDTASNRVYEAARDAAMDCAGWRDE